MEQKNILLSKTLWVNILVLLGTWFGIKELNIEVSEEIVVTGVAVVNIILRFLTKQPVKLL